MTYEEVKMDTAVETICRIIDELIVLAENLESTRKKRYGNELREIAGQLENVGYELKERK